MRAALIGLLIGVLVSLVLIINTAAGVLVASLIEPKEQLICHAPEEDAAPTDCYYDGERRGWVKVTN